MNAKEIRERARLSRKWATGRATEREILRCMELDRKAKAESDSTAKGASEMKHTKGPWTANINATYPIYAGVDRENCVHLALALNIDNSEEREANARLIAAAPELAEALQEIATWLICPALGAIPEMQEKARAALRKAGVLGE